MDADFRQGEFGTSESERKFAAWLDALSFLLGHSVDGDAQDATGGNPADGFADGLTPAQYAAELYAARRP